MFNTNNIDYLDAYLAIVESDLLVEQRTINQAQLISGSTMDLSVQQIKLHMKRRALESLKSR